MDKLWAIVSNTFPLKYMCFTFAILLFEKKLDFVYFLCQEKLDFKNRLIIFILFIYSHG